jgi:UDP-N-acetylmuramoyl-tripeptide--D-alanyl-D-alanine ligase
MSVIILATWVFLTLLAFARLSRWLAIVQQKEYRLDRLWLYIKSQTGRKDLFKILPQRADFTRVGFKRPKPTLRIILVGAVCLALYFPFWFVPVSIFFVTILFLLLIPLLVIISILPSFIIAKLKTDLEVARAIKTLAERHPLIIGITGSYGKSSTKKILAETLAKRYTVFATPKSFNTRYSVAHSLVTGYKQESVVILEYGAYGQGEIKKLASAFVPKIALITGLSLQHIGLFGSEKEIVVAKSELVTAVEAGGSIFYNDFNKKTKQIIEIGNSQTKQVFPSSKHPVCANWSGAGLNDLGQIYFYWGNKKITTKLIGLHYLETLQLVASTASFLGVSNPDIQDSFEKFTPRDVFISSHRLKSGALVIDDGGTSNPHGFMAAIELAKEIKGQQKILITPGIIDLGSEESVVHKELATKAKQVFHQVLLVGDAGAKEFEAVFGDNCVRLNPSVSHLVESFGPNWSKDTVILLEGRMPMWLTKNL